ncbi:hypothetical protein V493_01894 [Pseudogymnoascus sp. VKM F-4281 (FW-2241)]|nr:hypothetical protein V493_01894 [Pseudogymnoascus sp. VKM F-4281 (FW-2241)]
MCSKQASISLHLDTRNGQRTPSSAKEKQAAICTKQEQGRDPRGKRQSKELSRSASQEQDSITFQTTPQLPTGPFFQEQGKDQHAKDSAATLFRPAAQEQAAISNKWRTKVAKIRVT